MYEYIVNLSAEDFYIVLCDEEFLRKMKEINNKITYTRISNDTNNVLDEKNETVKYVQEATLKYMMSRIMCGDKKEDSEKMMSMLNREINLKDIIFNKDTDIDEELLDI